MKTETQESIFWEPGKQKPSLQREILLERPETVEGSGSTIVYNYQKGLSIPQQRLRLPVYKYRDQILYLLEKYQTLVLMGQTGCGKSTQVPQYLHETGWTQKGYMIAITQPRRLAAISVASRVADEMGIDVGSLCGYSIRFGDCFTPGTTKLRFMTDGFLVREMMRDSLLSLYSVIIVDEAHERTIHTDIVLGLLKKILKKRPELRLIISSATINVDEFAKFFDLSHSHRQSNIVSTSTILTIEQRMFPLEILYLQKSCPNYIQESINTVLAIHENESSGDILVFVTGQDEIDQAVSLLNEHKDTKSRTNEAILILPLYGSLPMREQIKVFQSPPVGFRKVIFSTNIAEASVTIHGICFVIDSGFCKMNFYDPNINLETLIITQISKDSANQRAGRAGRTRPGKVYRLYRETDYHKLPEHTIPEIQRQEMSTLILQLKGLGVEKVISFNFISPPSVHSMANGIQLLYALKCIDDSCELTDPLGKIMVEFPLHPSVAKMLLSSHEFNCSEEALTIAAMLQIETVFYNPSYKKKEAQRARLKFAALEGDHLTMLNVYNTFIKKNRHPGWCKSHFLNHKSLCQAEKIRHNLKSLLIKYKIPIVSCGRDDIAVRRCIVSGFFSKVAKYDASGDYKTLVGDKVLAIHPLSVLSCENPPPWVIFSQVVSSNKDYMRDVTVINPTWLCELVPHFYQYGTDREIAQNE